MKRIRSLELEQYETDKYKMMITFHNEKDEWSFIKGLSNSMRSKYIMSTFIQDLDSDIDLYKQYFINSSITIFEKGLMHPIIVCQDLQFDEALDVIDNFGYYTIEAYLYWSKSVIAAEKFVENKYKKENFMMDYSDLSIRQVLDLSLNITVTSQLLNNFMQFLVNWQSEEDLL